jgi:hypothetical protein
VRFNAFGREMEHRTKFQNPFGNTECPLYLPQLAVLTVNVFYRHRSIGNVTLQSVQFLILFGFVIVNFNVNIIRYFQKLVITPFVDFIFRYRARFVLFFEATRDTKSSNL